MAQTMRVSLPTYNALTDTNLDHFALHSDSDNILIKEKTRGSVNIASGGNTTIAHNLGYVPFFLVYVYDKNGRGWAYATANKWKLVSHQQSAVSVPPFYVWSHTNTLYIYNNDTTTDFKYYIFYDQQV